MDASTRAELERLRAEAIALCDRSRELAEHVVSLIDAELSASAPRRKTQRHLSVVKGIITGAAAAVALRRLASAASAGAVAAAAVTLVAVPLVVRSPHVPHAPRPVPSRSVVAPHHRGRHHAAGKRAPAGAAVTASPAPAAPSPLPSVLPSPVVPVSVSPPPCIIRLLGLCVP